MEIKGIIENGKLMKELVSYDCDECGETVRLEFNHAITERTYQLFSEMVGDRHCLSCHANKKVPELAECLVH
jgi:hypothetical protein